MRTKLALAAALAATAAAVTAVPASAAVAGKCLAKEVKVQGRSAIANCGSATATLRYKGATYRFKNGTCLKVAGTITLDLGTNVVGSDSKNNYGMSHFSLTMLSVSTAPVLATSGKLVINGSAKLSSRSAGGTFTGTNTIVNGTKLSEAPFSGSWHCGTVYAF
jgi:hypothetical protein